MKTYIDIPASPGENVGPNKIVGGNRLRAIELNSEGFVDAKSISNGSVSDAEFNTLNGITGNIQEQIDSIDVQSQMTDEQAEQILALIPDVEDLQERVTTIEGDYASKSGDNVFTGVNDFQDVTAFRKTAYGETTVNSGTTTINIDGREGNNQKINITQNTTLNFQYLIPGTIFNFEVVTNGTYTVNFNCYMGINIVDTIPKYSEGGIKPTFETAGVYHMTIKTSEIAAHFLFSGIFNEFTN